MIFYKTTSSSRPTTAASSTMSLYSMKLANEERCAHCLGLLAVICLIVSGVMLYFAIATQYSEQKTIYYIVFVVGVLGIFFFAGLTWSILSRIREKRECFWHVQMNTEAVRRNARMKQEELSEMRRSHSQLSLQQQQQQQQQTPRVSMQFINQSYQAEKPPPPPVEPRRQKLIPR